MKIKKLFNQYQSLIKQRFANRHQANQIIRENQAIKKKANKIREELIRLVKAKQAEGKTLYKICQEEFGEAGHYFHSIYLILMKGGDNHV